MKALLCKDFLIIKSELIKSLLIVFIFSLIGGSFTTLALLIGMYIPLITFAYDEYSKWNKFAKMLPYKKNDLQFSKYYLGFLCIILTSVLAIVIQYITSNISTTVTFDLNMYLLVISSVIIFQAINLPIIFKFGIEKGKFVFIALAAFVGVAGSFVGDIDLVGRLLNLSPYLMFGVSLILTAISMFISSKIEI